MHAQMSASSSLRISDLGRSAANKRPAMMSQDVWTRRCAVRLHQLRPQGEPGLLTRVANDLWLHVSQFGPETAAEIEHESGYWER